MTSLATGRSACQAITVILLAGLRIQCQPLLDYHQHFFSPATAKLSSGVAPVTAKDLISLLDLAGIRRGLVLSCAYQFGNPNRPPVENEYAAVKAENDWTSRQVSQFPDRLRGLLRGQSIERVCGRGDRTL